MTEINWKSRALAAEARVVEVERELTGDREAADIIRRGAKAMRPLVEQVEDLEARLSEALEALGPFKSFAEDNTAADPFEPSRGIWSGNRCERNRIVDWFGPSDFRLAAQVVGSGGETSSARRQSAPLDADASQLQATPCSDGGREP